MGLTVIYLHRYYTPVDIWTILRNTKLSTQCVHINLSRWAGTSTCHKLLQYALYVQLLHWSRFWCCSLFWKHPSLFVHWSTIGQGLVRCSETASSLILECSVLRFSFVWPFVAFICSHQPLLLPTRPLFRRVCLVVKCILASFRP